MYILGISCYYHDSAAVLLKDGILVAAAEEERFTRVKHDYSFPCQAIKFCLEYEGITGKDLDFVIFHEKPFLKFERIIKTIIATYPRSAHLFQEVAINWLKEKLWIKSRIAEFLDISENRILFCEHHLSHASSAFFCSPFKESAILTVDGVGEWATLTLGRAEGDWDGNGENRITILEQIDFPHSLGLLYSVFTAFLGFKVNNGEYKVMGMSAYGEPKYLDRIYELVSVNSDGSFRLNMKYFSYHYSTCRSFNNNFIKLFGSPRKPGQRFVVDRIKGATEDEIKENKRFADIASSIQKFTEDTLIKIANHLYNKTGSKNLCIAGGVALNCVANYKIFKNTPFENIFIQPAAGDSGAALGAALYLWHCFLNKKREFILNHSYWGKEYSQAEIDKFLQTEGITYKKVQDFKQLIDYVVSKIMDQKIVGWYQGRFEWGPRALGNRSILADPRNPDMKEIINNKIKFREPFRPFAPSVLKEHGYDFFELEDVEIHYPFRFMLYTVPGKNRDKIPAVIHVDGSSRIQIVDRNTNPLYYELIKEFYHRTGIPLVLNTSFNLKGEPIVNTPQDAYSTFLRSGIDILVMGDCVVEK
jgi:carbamoyltransferase